jgi:hypothetical protein
MYQMDNDVVGEVVTCGDGVVAGYNPEINALVV